MHLYEFGSIITWLINVIYAVALVVVIRLAIKVNKAIDIYINKNK